MKTARSSFADFSMAAGFGRSRFVPAWFAAAMLALVVVLMLAALPPRLADVCDQDGPVACGP